MGDLVLSLFPGIDLFGLAFEEQGFCVVRGPDIMFGSLHDIKQFSPPAGRFDGVIGGPPCQRFSRLRHIVEHNGYQLAENLIPQFERVVREAAPAWFVMENVPDAPEPVVAGYAVAPVLLNNRWCGGEQNRMRRFAFGVRGRVPVDPWRYIELEALEPARWEHAVTAASAQRVPVKRLRDGSVKRTAGDDRPRPLAESLRLQGLPAGFLDRTPFTASGKQRVVGNGVPLPLGRTIARAVVAMTGSSSTPSRDGA